MIIKGNIVDVINRYIFPGKIFIEDGKIISIEKISEPLSNFILPGLVDSHVHIESSMLIPSRFADLVVPRGTVAVVSDPHEIANVLGVEGVEYMLEDAKNVPLKCYFGAPSCVPATNFESAGSIISSNEVDYLFKNGAWFLSEMMNFPGVIYGDQEVMAKLKLAKTYDKTVDGHAPGLKGDDLVKYANAGISTDHECSTIDEAIEKIALGMKIQIREGSAARNFEALHTLLKTNPEDVMLCTDDSHPDMIISDGHIDRLIRMGLKKGLSIFDLYHAAVVNPVKHYKLPVGLLRKDDPADFIIVDNLNDFNVLSTFIEGVKVAENGKSLFNLPDSVSVNKFLCDKISVDDIKVFAPNDNPVIRVIEATDGELFTGEYKWKTASKCGDIITSDVKDDILKIVVVNRYNKAEPVIGFIKNFSLKKGALAGSVAHDSHNIVAIGCDDESLVDVINSVIADKGGIAATDGNICDILELPVAGLMSDKSGVEVAKKYSELNEFVINMGCKMKAPFMTLAFMSLLVIPSLKIGDKGLFDVNSFSFTELFVENE